MMDRYQQQFGRGFRRNQKPGTVMFFAPISHHVEALRVRVEFDQVRNQARAAGIGTLFDTLWNAECVRARQTTERGLDAKAVLNIALEMA